jgi:hypothetical protein
LGVCGFQVQIQGGDGVTPSERHATECI